MKYHVSVFLCFTFLLSACQQIKEPTLQRIEDVEIISLNKNRIELNANMVLNNPNTFALDLEKAVLVAVIDGVELATIDQTYETTMPSKGEFKMPVYVNMNLDRLYKDNPLAALGKGIQVMSDRQLEVHFKGKIFVGKGAAKISIPVDKVEVIKL